MTKERRLKTLQNFGILTLALVSMFYINELFGSQLSIFKGAVNSIVLPFGIALFLSYLLQPLVTLLESKLKIKNKTGYNSPVLIQSIKNNNDSNEIIEEFWIFFPVFR